MRGSDFGRKRKQKSWFISDEERARLIAEFFARGGKITRVHYGHTAAQSYLRNDCWVRRRHTQEDATV